MFLSTFFQVDATVGRIMTSLKSLGVDRDTLVSKAGS